MCYRFAFSSRGELLKVDTISGCFISKHFPGPFAGTQAAILPVLFVKSNVTHANEELLDVTGKSFPPRSSGLPMNLYGGDLRRQL